MIPTLRWLGRRLTHIETESEVNYAAVEQQREFLKRLAHELRNPLATILTTVELLGTRGNHSEETVQLLGVIGTQVHRMSDFLEDLLDIPRSTERGETLKKKMVVLGKLPEEPAAAAPEPLRILIVDDNESAARALGELLEFAGYTTDTVFGGVMGYERARAFKPDVMIIDIGMPVLDGYEVVELLRADSFPCTFIALTGFGQIHDKQRALDAGFDFHLTKPARLGEIEALLRRIKKQSRAATSSHR